MNSFVQQMRNLGPTRLAALAGVAVGLLAFIIFFATRFTSEPMELLYADLQPADASAIIEELESRGIPHEVRDADILVPADQVGRLRMQMAELALPGGGNMGYEVFDQMDSLGATNFMQSMNRVRALEGELGRTIRSIEGVAAARVHLVLPEREMFTRQARAPSASVYVKMQRGRLEKDQVLAVQHLIAAAVPDLEPSGVSIIDERGTLLSQGFEDETTLMVRTQEEMRRKVEARLAQAVETLLGRSVGPGRVRAEVRADMDFDRIAVEQEIYDPDSQVARSTVTREESIQQDESDPDTVTVDQNLPEADLDVTSMRATNAENRVEETVNYELSRKVVNQVTEGGRISRLSVAVLVDGAYRTDDAGERVYAPRDEAEMDQLAALARTAIGFDAARGDQLEIVNMPFTTLDEVEFEEPFTFMGFSKDEIMRMAEGLGVAIVAVLVILLVVRPLVTRAFESGAAGADAQMITAEGQVLAPQLAGPGGGVPAPIPEEEEFSDELIDIDKVEGRVKASSLRKIGEIVDKHPEEALSIIRNWLYQET